MYLVILNYIKNISDFDKSRIFEKIPKYEKTAKTRKLTNFQNLNKSTENEKWAERNFICLNRKVKKY